MLEGIKEFKKDVYGDAPPPSGGSAWAAVLVVAAIICGLVGFFGLTQATMGVGFVGLGLMAGVLARIAQARAQHKAVMSALGRRDG